MGPFREKGMRQGLVDAHSLLHVLFDQPGKEIDSIQPYSFLDLLVILHLTFLIFFNQLSEHLTLKGYLLAQ